MTDPVTSLAALDEPTRRRLYDYVVAQRHPVGRDEAATAVGVPRANAAFHLDKLVEAGLLDVVHERLTGRTGPGAGRPAKLYLRSREEVAVSLPGRRYDLAGALLAAAVEESERTGEPTRVTLAGCARRTGREIGSAAAEEGERDVCVVLAEHGFEPAAVADVIRLGNCPFHDLAQRHTALVCGMNVDLVAGILEGMADQTREATLAPEPDYCCVVLTDR